MKKIINLFSENIEYKYNYKLFNDFQKKVLIH